MNRLRYVLRSLTFFWRVNFAVGLGVVAATAVLTGALLVGDSMRGSLRKIALDGLGEIDEILLTDRFFRTELSEELADQDGFAQDFEQADSIILFPNASASVDSGADSGKTANKVTLIGCQNSFWEFSAESVRPRLPDGSLPNFDELDLNAISIPVVLNEPLANDLGITFDDLQEDEEEVLLTVQIPKPQLINADNPIGKKEDLYETIARLRVVDILPAESLGRFTLHPTQLLPRILFLPLSTVQEALEQEGFCNALIVSAKNASTGTSDSQSAQLNKMLEPTTEDLGLIFKQVQQTYQVPGTADAAPVEKESFRYVSLSSDQLLLTDKVVEVGRSAFEDLAAQPVLTYLATGIKWNPKEAETIPFSMVSAIDWSDEFQLRSAISGDPIDPLEDDQIVINSWSARDLLTTAGEIDENSTEDQIKERMRTMLGQSVTLEFFEPEAAHGKLIPREAKFSLADIAEITPPKTPFNRRRPARFDKAPTLANDPDLTPFVPGVTDQNSVNKWDLPFKTESRSQDDDYWQFYRTTPKAFVTLDAGQQLWASRFGKVTSLRIHGDATPEQLADRFLAAAESADVDFGFRFTPIKRRNFKASSGSTPFDVLFLALSFFIIASALILIALLFRLGVEQKARQLGLLSSVGLDHRQVGSLLAIEGFWISLIGSLVGLGVGVAYAQLMVYGLTTWWVGAVMTSFMQFHWTAQSLIIGFIIGVVVSQGTVWLTIRRLGKLSARELLSGRTGTQATEQFKMASWLPFAIGSCILLALTLSVVASTSLGGEAQAGAFMGGGFLMLTALLTITWIRLRRPAETFQGLSGKRLAFENAGRNPLRSTLTIGLVAAATFLIVAVSSFHLSPTEEGIGGFEYMAESSRPIVGDLQDPEVRQDVFRNPDDLDDLEIYSLRFLPGDEAGCNNPFQAQRPKVLGVTPSLVERFQPPANSDEAAPRFAFAASTAETEAEQANPWLLLDNETADGAVPVIIDKNTAMYSLKIFGVGGNYSVEFDGGQTVTFRVVGLLSNSTLQGSLIISEDNFVERFPSVSGYRSFLISENQSDSDEAESESRIAQLEKELEPYGFDATASITVLSEFLAVQNTYLSTFQSLGAFGLLLGTFGLATVQLRNVVERRRELALMRAVGFAQSKLGSIVLAEHALLLLAGMLIGIISALFSVLPHIIFGDAQVPLGLLTLVLFAILGVGMLSGMSAVRSSARTPILSTLRAEH